MIMELSKVTDALEGWFGFLKSNIKTIFKKLLSINIQSTVVLIIGMVLSAIALIAGLALGTIGAMAGTFLAIAIFFLSILLSSLVRLAAYKVIDEEHGAKNAVSAFSVAKSAGARVILMWILELIILFVLAVPFLALGLAIWTMATPAFAMPVIELGFILSAIVVGFFLQFSIYELVLGGYGPLDSIKRSYSSVRGNLIESIVMYFIRVALDSLVRVPFLLVLYGAIFFGVVVVAAGSIAAAALNPILSAVAVGIGVIVGALFFFAYLLAYITADDTIMLSLQYSYWKRLAAKAPAAPPIIPPEKMVKLAAKVRSASERK
jgi:hypothetical protein